MASIILADFYNWIVLLLAVYPYFNMVVTWVEIADFGNIFGPVCSCDDLEQILTGSAMQTVSSAAL